MPRMSAESLYKQQLLLEMDAVQGTFDWMADNGCPNEFLTKSLVLIKHSMNVGILKSILEQNEFQKGLDDEINS